MISSSSSFCSFSTYFWSWKETFSSDIRLSLRRLSLPPFLPCSLHRLFATCSIWNGRVWALIATATVASIDMNKYALRSKIYHIFVIFSSLQSPVHVWTLLFWFVTVGSDIRFYFLDWFSRKWNGKKRKQKKILWKEENWLSVSHQIFISVRVTTLIPSEDLIYCATVKVIFIRHTLPRSPPFLPLSLSLFRCSCESLVFSFIHCEKTGAWILDSAFRRKEWDSMWMNASGMRLLSRFCSSFGEVYYAVWKEAEHNNKKIKIKNYEWSVRLRYM